MLDDRHQHSECKKYGSRAGEQSSISRTLPKNSANAAMKPRTQAKKWMPTLDICSQSPFHLGRIRYFAITMVVNEGSSPAWCGGTTNRSLSVRIWDLGISKSWCYSLFVVRWSLFVMRGSLIVVRIIPDWKTLTLHFPPERDSFLTSYDNSQITR